LQGTQFDDGTYYEFGGTTVSQQYYWYEPAGSIRYYRWDLNLMQDVHGNVVNVWYTQDIYTKNGHDNVRAAYPAGLTYGPSQNQIMILFSSSYDPQQFGDNPFLPKFYNVNTKNDLLGQLILGFAPHTSAGVIGRVAIRIYEKHLIICLIGREVGGDIANINIPRWEKGTPIGASKLFLNHIRKRNIFIFHHVHSPYNNYSVLKKRLQKH
jgi:hypothetical protein